MNPDHPGVRLLAVLVLVFGGLVIHEIVQALAADPIIVDARLERAIPFLPWTIWVYFSFFLMIAWTSCVVDRARFWHFVLSAVLAALVAYPAGLSSP